MPELNNLLIALASCGASAIVLACLIRSKASALLLDKPNHRSMHTQSTPRIGGLVFIPISFLICAVTIAPTNHWRSGAIFLLAFALVFFLGVLDDRLGLSARIRLIAQFIAGVLAWLAIQLASQDFDMRPVIAAPLISGEVKFLPLIIAMFFVLMIVWSINLVNFMDGINGLVGGVSLAGICCLVWYIPNGSIKTALYALGGSLVAFIYFNAFAKKVFMGDAGSTSLGLILGALNTWGITVGYWDPLIAFVTFAPLLIDATLTLIGRILRGERFWEAHRSHIYQRLVSERSLSHLQVSALYSMATMSGCLLLTTVHLSPTLMRYSVAFVILFTYICIYYILNRWISTKN